MVSSDVSGHFEPKSFDPHSLDPCHIAHDMQYPSLIRFSDPTRAKDQSGVGMLANSKERLTGHPS